MKGSPESLILIFFISFVLTWAIGLAPPLLIRYLVLRRPVRKWPAIALCGIFWFLNVFLFTVMGSKSKSHGALVLVAFVSYWILRRKEKGYQAKNLRTTEVTARASPHRSANLDASAVDSDIRDRTYTKSVIWVLVTFPLAGIAIAIFLWLANEGEPNRKETQYHAAQSSSQPLSPITQDTGGLSDRILTENLSPDTSLPPTASNQKTVTGAERPEWSKRAAAFEKEKDWQELRDWSIEWTENQPRNTRAWYYLGFAYYALENYDDAIKACRESLRLNSEDAVVWSNLGSAYYRLKDYNEAITAYRESVRINPKNALAWYYLGLAYGDSGYLTAGLDVVRELEQIDKKMADNLFKQITVR